MSEIADLQKQLAALEVRVAALEPKNCKYCTLEIPKGDVCDHCIAAQNNAFSAFSKASGR